MMSYYCKCCDVGDLHCCSTLLKYASYLIDGVSMARVQIDVMAGAGGDAFICLHVDHNFGERRGLLSCPCEKVQYLQLAIEFRDNYMYKYIYS